MMKTLPKFTILKEDKATIIALFGRLDAKGASSLWQKITHQISAGNKTNLIFDLEKVDYLDTAGAAFICYLETYGKTRGFEGISSINLKQEYSTLLDLARNIRQKDFSKQRPQRLSFVENRGKNILNLLSETKEFITYMGEITWALVQSFRHPKKIRWSDTLLVAERSGVDALPIVALISFIVGLVMAFQAAIPMRMFGAELLCGQSHRDRHGERTRTLNDGHCPGRKILLCICR